jgi:hypothetical protein
MAITLDGTTGITTPALDADKIATTATGIDVTGTVTADGLKADSPLNTLSGLELT